MPRPRKVDEAMREKIAKVGRLRRMLESFSNKALAREAGCAPRTVNNIMHANMRALPVSRGTDIDELAREVEELCPSQE